MKSISIPPVYFITGCLIIILARWILPGLNIIPFPYNLTGLIVMFAGLYPLFTAHDLFSKYQTTQTFDKSTSLVTEGIYRYTRNPMYLGMALLLLGLSLCFRNVIGLIVPVLFFLIIDLVFIPFEEKKMEITFGESYLAYKDKVRKWI